MWYIFARRGRREGTVAAAIFNLIVSAIVCAVCVIFYSEAVFLALEIAGNAVWVITVATMGTWPVFAVWALDGFD